MPILSRRQIWRNPRIKDPAYEVTAEANLRVRSPLGLQQANRRRRFMLTAAAAANRLRLNAWLAPYDDTHYTGEVNLNELDRVLDFTEMERTSFTEVTR